MKKTSLITLASLAALSVSAGAFSSSALAGGGMHMKRGHHMMYMLMDTNKDGSVSQEEFQSFRVQNFSSADKNRDGSLTPEEFSALARIMKEQREKAMEMARQEKEQKHFGKLDADGDGKISKAEFEAKGERSFIRMDQNDDGVLNKEDSPRKMHKMRKMHERDGRR